MRRNLLAPGAVTASQLPALASAVRTWLDRHPEDFSALSPLLAELRRHHPGFARVWRFPEVLDEKGSPRPDPFGLRDPRRIAVARTLVRQLQAFFAGESGALEIPWLKGFRARPSGRGPEDLLDHLVQRLLGQARRLLNDGRRAAMALLIARQLAELLAPESLSAETYFALLAQIQVTEALLCLSHGHLGQGAVAYAHARVLSCGTHRAEVEAEVLFTAGFLAWCLGHPAAATRSLRMAGDLFTRIGDFPRQARVRMVLDAMRGHVPEHA